MLESSSPVCVLNGTIETDGVLRLASPVALPPGPVRIEVRPAVTVRSAAEKWRGLDEIWERRRQRGAVSRTKEEIDEDLRQQRQEWEDRQQMLDACRPTR